MILILAGTRQEAEDWCRAHKTSLISPDVKFIREIADLWGLGPGHPVMRIGTWVDNPAYRGADFQAFLKKIETRP